MRACWIGWSLGLLLGCEAPKQIFEVDDPNVSHVALISVGEDGALLGATPLVPYDSAVPLTLTPPAAEGSLRLLAYAAETLAPLLPVEDEPLWAARQCQATLPPPLVVLPAAEASLPVPLLGAPWLDARCPTVDPDQIWIEQSCSTPRCKLEVNTRTACEFRVTTEDCALGDFDLKVHPSGQLCAGGGTLEQMCADAGQLRASLSCGVNSDCGVDIYTEHAARDLGFSVERLTLGAEVRDYLPTAPRNSRDLGRGDFYSGHAFDLAVHGERVLVSTSRGGSESLASCPSEWRTVDDLVLIDRVTMTIVERSQQDYSCLDVIVPDPRGDGFFAVMSRDAGNWSLVRLDRNANITFERNLRIPLGGEIVRWRNVRWIHPLPERGELALVFNIRKVDVVRETHVAFFDIDTFDALGDVIELDEQGVSSHVEDDELVLLVEQRRQLIGLDLARKTQRMLGLLDTDPDIKGKVFGAARVGEDYLIVGIGSAELYLVEPSGAYRGVAHHEIDAALTSLLRWNGRWLAFGVELDSWRAFVVEVDPQAPRVLHGVTYLGHGVVSRTERDADGDLWLLLPWAGEVLRLSPE